MVSVGEPIMFVSIAFRYQFEKRCDVVIVATVDIFLLFYSVT